MILGIGTLAFAIGFVVVGILSSDIRTRTWEWRFWVVGWALLLLHSANDIITAVGSP